MLFSYNWLKDYLKYDLTEKDIKFLLMSYSPLEVEKMEKVNKDTIFDIKILANRMSDCSHHFGLAREINILAKTYFAKRQLTRQKTGFATFKILKTISLKTADFIDIEIQSNKDCLRYGGVLLKLSKNFKDLDFIKERLQLVNVKTINPIVDISNYVMIDSGQPTHAFDFDKLDISTVANSKKKIIIRRAKKGEFINALDGKKYDLDPDILVIADQTKPIAIAGIKGGVETAISSSTKIVFLEYAIFNPELIYTASKKLSLNSDASVRFSHKVSLDSMQRSITLFKKLISHFDVAYPSSSEVMKGTYKESSKKILIDQNDFKDRLSLEIKPSKIISLLKSIGCSVKQKGKNFEVLTPSFRMDLTIKEDLIEEVGRIYGFNNIPRKFLLGSISPIKENEKYNKEYLIKETLSFCGFDEIYTSSLISKSQLNYLNLPNQDKLKVKNPLSKEHEYLRPSLIPGLINCISRNDDNFQSIKIFEIGNVFLYQNDKMKSTVNLFNFNQNNEKEVKSLFNPKLIERKNLALVSYGGQKNQETLSEFIDFFEVKQALKSVFQKLKIGNFELREFNSKQKYCDQAFEIIYNDQNIGLIGYLDSDLLLKFDIKRQVAFCEIYLDAITEAKPIFNNFKAISPFPCIIRDISFFIEETIFYQDIEKTIKLAKINFLEDFYLIDVFKSKNNYGTELLSLTVRFIFRHLQRTLTNEEANSQKSKIEKLLIEKFKAKIR